MSVLLPTAQTKARVSRPVPTTVDVAIIGAGLGGLMTAARLLQAGRSVAVLDAHYVAGGCATMFARGSGDARYTFDIGVHYLGGCKTGGRLPTLLKEVGVEVDWCPLDPDGFDELIFPDLRFRIPSNVDLYRERLVALFPKEKAGIDRYIRLLNEVRLLGRPDAPRGWRQAWEALSSGRLAAAHRNSTLAVFLDSCTQNPQLRAIIAGQNGDYGLGPSRVSAMLHAGLVNHYFEGAYYPKGGGQVIADKLAERVEQLGGSIHLRHPVTKIRVEGGRAVGLAYQGPHGDAGELRAKTVVSNADLRRTLLELLPSEHLKADVRQKAEHYEMGGAIFLTCLAVKANLKALGMGATNYWAFDNYDFDALYTEVDGDALPPVRGCYITSATVKDPQSPGHAPPGVETVEIMALMPGRSEVWGVPQAAVWGPGYRREAVYQERKQKVEADLIGRLEKLFPTSTKEILHQESATPVSHSRFTWASGGSGYGLAATPEQFLERRPGYRGPIDGMFLCGASTRAGHGVVGALASGAHAAKAILKDA